MRVVQVRSFAKINLGLEVLGVRGDGYHELRTLFQTIDLHDTIELRPHPSDVTVSCDHPGVPADATNLAARAALELRSYAGFRGGVEIRIRKRIPVGGGLGGGSSNAAAVLMALDRLWALGLGGPGLHPLARRLGADVPYFLVGGTALGLARGDEVFPLHRQVLCHVVVVDAGMPVSTAAVFRRVDQSLTPRENSYTIFRFVSRDLEGDGGFPILSNDLESAALAESPELAQKAGTIRGILVGEGALMAALSGSGSSYFGLFAQARTARRAEAVLGKLGLKALRGRTLSREEYRRVWSRSLGSWHARGGGRGKERTSWRSRT